MTRKGNELNAALMSTERPLDALLPELTTQQPALPREPLHPRVLELGPDEGDAWVFALWQDPGSLPAIHQGVRQLAEATLLAHLSRPASAGEAIDRAPGRLLLLAFTGVQGNLGDAVRAFGFRPQLDAVPASDPLRALVAEGRQVGHTVPDAPVSTWVAPVGARDGALRAKLDELGRVMRERIGDDVWGNIPGAFSRLLAVLVEEYFNETIRPDLDGLRSLELLLVPQGPAGVVRWTHPLLFQALCDFVGVVIHTTWGYPVEWALCEPEDNGFAPPAVLRITRPERQEHLPVAMHLLRWCVMPVLEGEQIPSLAEWLESEFAPQPRH